jgi:RNA polymerase sigma-70 factor (ECF subfamily)
MLADDLTAATFERCWNALPGFEPQRTTLRPWLFRIAANELASHYRSDRRRRQREHLVAVRDEPLQAAAHVDDAAVLDDSRVLEALSSLTARHQEVLTLRFLADLTTSEAAEAMDVGTRHLAVLQYRALRALRRTLEETPDG